MSIYPTLTDLCGIPTPAHVQGKSLRPLLADPKAPWDQPAITTYKYMNHAVRTEDYRYIRYADGGEEFYDERKDPYEWTNLVEQGGVQRAKGRIWASPCRRRTSPTSAAAGTPGRKKACR